MFRGKNVNLCQSLSATMCRRRSVTTCRRSSASWCQPRTATRCRSSTAWTCRRRSATWCRGNSVTRFLSSTARRWLDLIARKSLTKCVTLLPARSAIVYQVESANVIKSKKFMPFVLFSWSTNTTNSCSQLYFCSGRMSPLSAPSVRHDLQEAL